MSAPTRTPPSTTEEATAKPDQAGAAGAPPKAAPTARLGTWASLKAMTRSWRLASVSLLSFSSGLPLGLVWIAIPTWMTEIGVDIKVVGLFSLAQAPWTFKFFWSPLMDRYPLPWLGRKRGWILLSQVVLVGLGLWLAGVSDNPEALWVIGALALAIAFASATQDIAIDAYTVEVLRKEEQGAAVGARIALYRAAMYVSGGLSITLAASYSWKLVNLLLALCYLPFLFVTWRAPEPEAVPEAPRTLREAVWGPFVGFLAQHRAVEILAFVMLYKLSENLAQALTRPFLVQTGFNAVDVGVATATIGLVAILAGTFLGGILTNTLGLGRALWIFGLIQTTAHLGYAAVAQVGVNRPLMYGAQAFEMLAGGMGTGAFSVLLLRLTQKRFSATQYALLSSLFSLPRILAGPVAGIIADKLGWRDFFILTVFTGIPGLVMLHRFVPWGMREPVFNVEAPRTGAPVTKGALVARAVAAGAAAMVGGFLLTALLGALRSLRAKKGFDFLGQLGAVLSPSGLSEWTTFVGIVLLGVTAAITTAALLAARRGVAASPAVARPGVVGPGADGMPPPSQR
jgi:PAT family beta-lactamase induction signal transducer AmpG